MVFEWDKNKNEINRKRHGVSFDVAKLVFFDPCCITLFDRIEDGEERWHSMGLVNGVLLLLVVHTTKYAGQTEITRIISARRTTSHERKCYENGY
ncbi:MAG: BrnT family toxin [Deltaproteobacteria bacterium]|nr:BrnT family toxin [Deltaproteobacteria bacterium]